MSDFKTPVKPVLTKVKKHISYKHLIRHYIPTIFILIIFLASGMVSYSMQKEEKAKFAKQIQEAKIQQENLNKDITRIQQELITVKSEDQYLKNKQLEGEIKHIHDNYLKLATIYEDLLDLKSNTKNTKEIDQLFAQTLKQLSDKEYASASSNLETLDNKIKDEKEKMVTAFSIPKEIVVNNSAPGSGFRRQRVDIESGSYLLDIIAGDLNSTRVIIDTASEGDCRDNCPVMSLGAYASRNGAWAGINGSYFCPASYPSCAGKTNSFDTLLMNKNKKYFNSDNNVYSNVPAAIFSGNSVRFVGRSLEWGRDTGVDGVIANQPLLLSGGNIAVGSDTEVKRLSKGSRSFVGSKGNIIYIGVVHNATVIEVASVLKTIGLDGALNLDSGGSTALIFQGSYKVGPGRDIPNAILLVHK